MRSRLPVLAAITLLGAFAPMHTAAAHPRLVKSSPAADSKSAEAPRQVSLTFNEPLDLALARISLRHGEMGLPLDSLRLAPGDDKTVMATIGAALAPGRYVVQWQVTGDDGHPVRGEFAFTVTADGAPSTAARPSTHR